LVGGSGFIGSHLAEWLVEHSLAQSVVLVDIERPKGSLSRSTTFVRADVRARLEPMLLGPPADLIVNLAAVHREPGHEAREYFETNVLGAENVCRYASDTGCSKIVFTSSISVYGPTEEAKDEYSLPVPTSPYGASKLVAERVHEVWQRSGENRSLVVVRPGVVFGPRENGNVTRLVRAVAAGYFVYTGNRSVRKAGGYVKELCRTIIWALNLVEERRVGRFTYNFTLDPPARLDEFVQTVAAVAESNPARISIPYRSLLAASHVAELGARLLGIRQPFHPHRIRKLVRSNNIRPSALLENAYDFQYTLRSAMEDWRHTQPSDWRRTL
jgi:GlcNAc-P-P-Und epimerase